MNWKEHYNRLIQRAKEREISGYIEKHHIIPKCMGGTNEKENLVKLTGREHFIAHLLLFKIHPKEYGLIKAVQMMCIYSNNQIRVNNRMYSWLKEKFSLQMSISQTGEKNSQYGSKWIHNLETKENKKLKLNESLPNGYIFGKYKIPKNEKIKKEIKLKKEKNDKIETYNYYYSIYKEVGFEKFKEITGYKFTKQNLVQRFANLVDDFIPQNGKPRNKA